MTLLLLGSKGPAVKDLQLHLNLLRAGLKPDGVFGGNTEAAVKAFQTKAGLVVDGKAGPQTVKALKEATTPAKIRRPEPDKSAMVGERVPTAPGSSLRTPPPNVGTLKLLDTDRPISELIIHCTATAEGKDYTVDDIRAWHKQRGFADIGYHYVIYRDGRIMIGRPIGQVGAHVENHNTGSIGVSYVGGVAADGKTAKDTRTPAQRASLLWLADQLTHKFKLRKITGHNQYANKACPSFDVRQDPLGKIVGT